jgi:hypothetical protein
MSVVLGVGCIECAVACVLCVGTGGSCSYCDRVVLQRCVFWWKLQVTCGLMYVDNFYR